jgi:hypothetical protein
MPLPPLTRREVEAQRRRDPKAVSTWWRALTPEQQEHALNQFPALVGALDGVPAVGRDRANRRVLDEMRERLVARSEQMADRIADLRAHHPKAVGSCWDTNAPSASG